MSIKSVYEQHDIDQDLLYTLVSLNGFQGFMFLKYLTAEETGEDYLALDPHTLVFDDESFSYNDGIDKNVAIIGTESGWVLSNCEDKSIEVPWELLDNSDFSRQIN